MKVQLKKGILEIFVLAILTKGDSYGYKLISDLSKHIEMSESTLYPILRRLEADKFLRTYNEIYQGRNRKYYAITHAGRNQLDEFVNDWETIRKVFDILKG